jgi:dTDP-4-amino-4,6-dideoxygalactose transaminase
MIPFADLALQHERLRHELQPVITGVLLGGTFVLGPSVESFEAAFASYCGAAFGIGVNSGTSALHLALQAAGIGPGDEVITTAFTFVATIAAITYTGATPVLVDVDPDTLTLRPDLAAAAITPRTRALVPVHLYGHPADMDPLLALAARHNLTVIEDTAQAHGATYKGRTVGSLGDAGCFSFYPSKNLGAAGDAGLIVTSDPELAARMRRLRSWGQAGDALPLDRGFNCRMAAVQGAVLGVKLRHLDAWNARRRANAARYDAAIAGPVLTPFRPRPWAVHSYSIYAVRARERQRVRAAFQRLGIDTRVHYPVPVHLLEPWTGLGYRAGDFPEAERAAADTVSLPVHPELSDEQVAAVADAIRAISASTEIVASLAPMTPPSDLSPTEFR